MSVFSVVFILGLLFLKHFLCDFVLQTQYMMAKKDNYIDAVGAFLHSFLHGFFTFLVLILFCDIKLAAVLATADLFIHYHVDFLKAVISNKLKVEGIHQKKFWNLFGLDQLIHAWTYIGIFFMVENNYYVSHWLKS